MLRSKKFKVCNKPYNYSYQIQYIYFNLLLSYFHSIIPLSQSDYSQFLSPGAARGSPVPALEPDRLLVEVL